MRQGGNGTAARGWQSVSKLCATLPSAFMPLPASMPSPAPPPLPAHTHSMPAAAVNQPTIQAEPEKILCEDDCVAALDKIATVKTESGLEYKDIVVGKGITPPTGYQVWRDLCSSRWAQVFLHAARAYFTHWLLGFLIVDTLSYRHLCTHHHTSAPMVLCTPSLLAGPACCMP